MTEEFNKWAKYVADIERLETENAELSSKTEQLEKKLKIAVDALKEIDEYIDDGITVFNVDYALKQIKEVK